MKSLLEKLEGFLEKALEVVKLRTHVDTPWIDLYGKDVPHTMNYPKGSMYEAFVDAMQKYPKYIAYNYYGKKATYTKFNEQIIEAAKGLKKLGIRKGTKVTICMPNTPDAIILFYAINLTGGVANMIHPLSSENEIEFYLLKSDSRYILCLDKIYPKVEKVISSTKVKKVIISKVSNKMPLFNKLIFPFIMKSTKIEYNENVISWNTFITNGKNYKGNIKERVRKHDDAVILYSGGTTGNPKGVVLSNLNFNALGTQCFAMSDPAKAGESVLAIMPIFHGFGLGVCIHAELISGMTSILIPQFKPQEFAGLIKKYQPAFLAGVPTMYEALIQSKEKSKTYLKCVSNMMCGGDTLNESLRKKVNDYLKEHGSVANIRVGYGLTESTGACCLTPRFYYKEGGIGIPFPDTLFKIVKTDTLITAETNEVGEICINGPSIMKGYLNNSAETRKALRRHKDGRTWLHTGDLGYMNEEGLVFFKARLKRMIISSGYNIYPQYIEEVLMSHPAVLTAAVVGVPHPYKQQVPIAHIVLRDNFDDTEDLRNDISKYCSKSISKYALPYEYVYVKDLPKTKVGKIAFNELGKEYNEKQKN